MKSWATPKGAERQGLVLGSEPIEFHLMVENSQIMERPGEGPVPGSE